MTEISLALEYSTKSLFNSAIGSNESHNLVPYMERMTQILKSYLLNPHEVHSHDTQQGQIISSVQFHRSVVSNSLWPHGLQHTRLPWTPPTPRAYSNSCPLSRWCHPTVSSSVVPLSPTFNLSKHQGLFKWISSLHQVAKVLEFQLQHQSFQ